MKFRFAIVTALLVALTSVAVAVPVTGLRPYSMPAQQQGGPSEILREGLSKLIAFMRQEGRPSGDQVQQFLDEKIAPYFDFEYMTKWIAGPKYRNMTAKERAKMEVRLENAFLRALAKRLGDYSNQKVRILRPRRGRGNEVTVRVGILRQGGYPAKLDFRFYRGEDGWKIFDVVANGTSALVHYRQKFKRSDRMRPGTPSGPARWGSRM